MQSLDIPRPEHPRPDFVRQPWLNLNGRWRFTFDPNNEGEQDRWHRVSALGNTTPAEGNMGTMELAEDPFGDLIVVPFPWESKLSQIGDTQYKGAAWYQRVIEVPADWGSDGGNDRGQTGGEPARAARGLASAEDAATAAMPRRWRLKPFLCFGAVDWSAKVWINGRFAGEHEGGYGPFDLDISNYVRPGRPATLTVRVHDATDADKPLGKQVKRWYTHTSGIWQTVWLEGRAPAFLRRIHVTPNLEDGLASFDLAIEASPELAGALYRVEVRAEDDAFPVASETLTLRPGVSEHTLAVRVPNPHAWSPEDPHLYDCTVRLIPESPTPEDEATDELRTYFGLRSISRGRWDDRLYEFVLLNGEPVFLRGALDQAFHPDGIHSYPSDEAIRGDIQIAKDLGLNMLRCHIKVNDPRYYYWADRLGVLIMYDLPSADLYTPAARANWERTFRDAVERDYSHPSILAWILFNETWGLEEHYTPVSWSWVKEMFELAKRLDSSRLVEDNSACLFDHVVTDLNTWHFYIDDYDRARRHVERVVAMTGEGKDFNYVAGLYRHVEGSTAFRQGIVPLLNSEYAGLSARQGDRDVSYTFKFLTSELRRHDKVCGYVYTELTDVEWEHNGFVNYDRSPKEFGYDAFVPGMRVADLNGADFVGFDCPPCQTLAPGSVFTAPAFVSHWDKRPLDGARLRWRVTAVDSLGEPHYVSEGRREVRPRRYGVIDAGTVEVRLPERNCLVTAALWLEDGEGAIRARNYVNLDVYAPPVEAPVRATHGYALSFSPGSFADCSWPNPAIGRAGSKFGAGGAGWVEYVVDLPAGIEPDDVHGLRFRFEAGARTARYRIGWKDRQYVLRTDYPQTESLKIPSEVVVTINGVSLGAVTLADDPADARGVLSLHLQEHWEFASYGFVHTLVADESSARGILDAALGAGSGRQLRVRLEVPRGRSRGGLNLYGARMGSTPLDPTVFLDTRG